MYMFIFVCVEMILKDPDIDSVLSDRCTYYSRFYGFSNLSTMSLYCPYNQHCARCSKEVTHGVDVV